LPTRDPVIATEAPVRSRVTAIDGLRGVAIILVSLILAVLLGAYLSGTLQVEARTLVAILVRAGYGNGFLARLCTARPMQAPASGGRSGMSATRYAGRTSRASVKLSA
jgi:hypothetical protein